MLRAASLYFHRGLRKCFPNDYGAYLTVLLAVDWIMTCRVIHLPTFQPPVDGARSLASSPVKGFYRKIKSLVWYLLGSFDRSAVSLRNLKIILNYS